MSFIFEIKAVYLSRRSAIFYGLRYVANKVCNYLFKKWVNYNVYFA